ncbi:HpcH/HpaI aldolase/citrate lyase family protein [Lewinella sp. W8]|uniref:HpcH/HpaI aldolase family protein n=1 Tax=Lewinella sp. W8 TaxID=2528208 RepID=UPI001067F647|nr:aldolase/citrate lyase family protein [Lewinella sp. W8]MTB50081.1 2,4-dihydroxyhept-2-ene-1,7-dioic acid aldolase [Lewinella sp. W8]
MHLRSRLQQATPLYNLFQNTPGSWNTEWISAGGVESITLDLQHGMVEQTDLLPILQAMRAGGSIPLVRLAWNRPELIMKALDYGVEGLICPMVDSAADAAAFVRAAKYPPLGNRSFGPFRAGLHTDEYFARANAETLCFSMVETAGAVKELAAIAATPGLDGLYVGPFDLSVSLGLEKRADFSDPELLRVIDEVLAAAKRNNLFTGIFTVDPQDARAMAERGFDLVTCGTANLVFQQAMRDWQAAWEA